MTTVALLPSSFARVLHAYDHEPDSRQQDCNQDPDPTKKTGDRSADSSTGSSNGMLGGGIAGASIDIFAGASSANPAGGDDAAAANKLHTNLFLQTMTKSKTGDATQGAGKYAASLGEASGETNLGHSESHHHPIHLQYSGMSVALVMRPRSMYPPSYDTY